MNYYIYTISIKKYHLSPRFTDGKDFPTENTSFLILYNHEPE